MHAGLVSTQQRVWSATCAGHAARTHNPQLHIAQFNHESMQPKPRYQSYVLPHLLPVMRAVHVVAMRPVVACTTHVTDELLRVKYITQGLVHTSAPLEWQAHHCLQPSAAQSALEPASAAAAAAAAPATAWEHPVGTPSWFMRPVGSSCI